MLPETIGDPPRVLAPYVRVGVQDETLFLGFGSIRRPVSDRALWAPLLRLADHFGEPRTRQEAVAHLCDDGDFDRATAEAALEILESGNYLIRADAYDRTDRYSRHALFYELSGADSARVQRSLAESHVLLVGCGGIGNMVAATLATAGVGELTLVDGDHVELSNLTRQFLFTESDVGSPKADVLARELRRRHPRTRVHTVRRQVTDDTLPALPYADLLVLSADSPGLTSRVNAHCVASGRAWLNACYVNDIAVWGPLVVPGETGCWDCRPLTAGSPSDPGPAESAARINRRYQAPSNGPVNMLASSLASLDVLRHLGRFGTPASWNRRVGVWSHDLSLDGQDVEPDPGCPTCAGTAPADPAERKTL